MSKLNTGWDVVEEFSQASLADPRRTKRLLKMVAALAEDPQRSLPKAMGDEAGLEAAYRFLGNENVSMEAIMEPHFRRTAERARKCREVFALHDGTEFQFPGVRREGLGQVRLRGQGFFSFVTLLVPADESRAPFGLIGWKNTTRKFGRVQKTRLEKRQTPRHLRESQKWDDGVELTLERLAGGPAVIHVMDREADAFSLLHAMKARGNRFIIRVAQNRKLSLENDLPDFLFERLQGGVEMFRREVPLSMRKKGNGNVLKPQNPPRKKRLAHLAFSAQCISLNRPDKYRDVPKDTALPLNFVHVYEPEPPAGEAPVDWKLVTSEPIQTVQDIERIVDGYRKRWIIEEYFKALKTGCAFERSQLESLGSLENLLGVLAPIACNLLVLRALADVHPAAPATEALTSRQIEVLAAFAPKLPASPTVNDALLAIAALGGHLKRNGRPGWLVLLRGFQTLNLYEAGWTAARNHHNTCDL